MPTADARRAAEIVEETQQEVDIRGWHAEGLRLLAHAEHAATEHLKETGEAPPGSHDVLDASARAAIEEVAAAMSMSHATRVDTVPRAFAAVAPEEEPVVPPPVLSKRLLVVSVVVLFVITVVGGFSFTALELEHELHDARRARVKPYDAFMRILPSLNEEDARWIWTELYQAATSVDYRCGICDDARHAYSAFRSAPLEPGNRDRLRTELGRICRGDHALKFCNWRLYGATFFTLTCYTTIGYGNFTPQTTGGRAFVVVVTVLGMIAAFPLFAQLGERLLRGLRQLPIVESQRGLLLAVGFLSYVALAALYFYELHLIEDEPNYVTTLYWAFVTLSTLGLGDVVPKTHRGMAVVSFFVFVIGGISLMSLVIQYLQEQSLPKICTGHDDAPTHSEGAIEEFALSAAPDVHDAVDRHGLQPHGQARS